MHQLPFILQTTIIVLAGIGLGYVIDLALERFWWGNHAD